MAAIPLRRPLGRFGVLSALIIGSMTPDFHYCVVSMRLKAEPANFRFLLKEAFLNGLATPIWLVAIYCCGRQILTVRDK
jgi:hypothetical protein